MDKECPVEKCKWYSFGMPFNCISEDEGYVAKCDLYCKVVAYEKLVDRVKDDCIACLATLKAAGYVECDMCKNYHVLKLAGEWDRFMKSIDRIRVTNG